MQLLIGLAHVATLLFGNRSFYAEPSCMDGQYDEVKFKDYVEHYCSVAPLTQYDRTNLIKLYLYQLAVCDYYSQYLADIHKKEKSICYRLQFCN